MLGCSRNSRLHDRYVSICSIFLCVATLSPDAAGMDTDLTFPNTLGPLVVPISSPTKSTRTPRTPLSAISFHSNQPQHSFWPPTPVGPVNPTSDARKDVISSFRDSMASSYRRGSTSTLTAPRVSFFLQYNTFLGEIPAESSFPLHRDFLITQSTTLRRLLSANAFHDIATDAASPQTGKNPPPGYGAYVIPTPVGRYPSVFLPVPDPGSLGVLIHWLYWYVIPTEFQFLICPACPPNSVLRIRLRYTVIFGRRGRRKAYRISQG